MARQNDEATNETTPAAARSAQPDAATTTAADPLPPDAEKDPDDWVTGDESMTGPQASYLRTLAHEAGEEFDETMTKAEASKRIDELQAKTGRGRDH